MMPRPLLLLLLLIGLAPVARAADPVSVKIRRIGLEGFYVPGGSPTAVEIELKNTTDKSLSFDLHVKEANLEYGSAAATEEYTLPMSLNPGEERVATVPLRLVEQEHSAIFAVARDAQGTALGKAGRDPGPKTEGNIIAMLCATPEICRTIRQSVLLSGTAEEQTRKSQLLRLVELNEPPSVGWAYGAASTVIVAAPAGKLSRAQREALEIFLHRGGSVILIEDQLRDDVSGRAKSPPQNSEPGFLDAYRRHALEGKRLTAGDGQFVHFGSITGKDFGEYCRALAVSQSTPKEVRELVDRFLRKGESGQRGAVATWLMRRLGTTFHFPSFLEMLLWIIAYLVLVGLINFVILRWIGKLEWGWITIPAIAVLFSILLYGVSARNHPQNFGADEMTVYRMDNLSSLATSESKVRISAPVRSHVSPVLPGTLILEHRQRFDLEFNFGVAQGGNEPISDIRLGETWETTFPLRRWSFRDLEFEGQRRFAGTVYRDKIGQLHNDTGVNFTQAIVLDEDDVFLLGEFPAGAVVDLGHVPRHAYRAETGRMPFGGRQYPGPPFWIGRGEFQPQFTKEEWTRNNAEFEALASQPFSLLELIHGWPRDGADVFFETKAAFFGLSKEATQGVTLRDHPADQKANTLTVVTFGEWP
jgi:hypothetical protein